MGAVLVLLITAVLAGFFIWQRFFRRGLYDDEQKENAFDFSKSRVNAKNPIDPETKDVIESNSDEKNNSHQPTKNEAGNETTF